jgi:Rubredoxin-like zinc ribbon domain (DUF35_N)
MKPKPIKFSKRRRSDPPKIEKVPGRRCPRCGQVHYPPRGFDGWMIDADWMAEQVWIEELCAERGEIGSSCTERVLLTLKRKVDDLETRVSYLEKWRSG